jgi:parvulin-like peptidyl-prolyl isomerase
MRAHIFTLLAASFCIAVSGAGCRTAKPAAQPPPDVSRPKIKTTAELSGERERAIAAGEIVPTTSPAIASVERPAPTSRAARPRLEPVAGAIEADVLLVDDAVITVPEVLYPIRNELKEQRKTRTRAGWLEEARRLIRRRLQEEIGTVLIYREARGQLKDEQKKTMDAVIDKEMKAQVAREFDGSEARLESHLKELGLTRQQVRDMLGRQMVVRQYSREKLMPQVHVRRDELLTFYKANLGRYQRDETRELLLIELPFARFLPTGMSWDAAGASERAQAKLRALRRAREAQAALAERPFAEVAQEYSLGLHTDGSYGQLGRPLQAPYETVSKLIFEYEEGQTSEPIETEQGWYIVRCGKVETAAQQAFADVQDDIRKELEEQRFSKLSTDYILRLAGEATISPIEPFLNAAVERADRMTKE